MLLFDGVGLFFSFPCFLDLVVGHLDVRVDHVGLLNIGDHVAGLIVGKRLGDVEIVGNHSTAEHRDEFVVGQEFDHFVLEVEPELLELLFAFGGIAVFRGVVGHVLKLGGRLHLQFQL